MKELNAILHVLHTDALLALMEYILVCHPRVLFHPAVGGVGGTSGNESPFCNAILSAILCRCVELSSKHVAFLAGLCGSNGISSYSLLLILYHTRQSLRRTQATQVLQALCSLALHRKPIVAGEATASHISVQSTVLSLLLVRCMELEAVHEGHDMRLLLCRALLLHGSDMQKEIRAACGWWCRKGTTSRRRAEVRNDSYIKKGNASLLSLPLEIELSDASSPAAAFAAMEAASRLLNLPDVNKEYLLLLARRRVLVSSRSPSCTGSVGPISVKLGPSVASTNTISCKVPPALHQEIPAAKQLKGEARLLGLEALTRRLLDVTQLHSAVSLVDAVLQNCPALSQLLVHRIFQLCLAEEHWDVSPAEVSAAEELTVEVLTALYRLLPHVDVADTLEEVIMYCGPACVRCEEACARSSTSLTLYYSLIKCVALHIPPDTLPKLFWRLHRKRELAAFRVSSIMLRILLQSVEYSALGSFTAEEVGIVHSFVQQERTKVDPCVVIEHQQEGKELKNSDNSTAESSGALLDAIDEYTRMRLQCVGNFKSLSLYLLGSPNDAVEGDSTSAQHAFSVALMDMFGLKAASYVGPTAVLRYREVLAWLYVVYHMSISVGCDVEVLTKLATTQGMKLRISERCRVLVELSESLTDNVVMTAFSSQVLRQESVAENPGWNICFKSWLLRRQQSQAELQHVLAGADFDESAAAFISYVALSQNDTAVIHQIKQRTSWTSCAAVLLRTDTELNSEKYRAPFSGSEGGVTFCANFNIDNTSGGTCGGGVVREQVALVGEVLAVAKCAIKFAEGWWDNPYYENSEMPATAQLACIWAHTDLLFLEEDCVRKLEHYEALLRLCKGERYVKFLQHLPEGTHSDIFGLTLGMWQRGLALLGLAEQLPQSFSLPAEVYRTSMRACLMNRVPIPTFIRQKAMGLGPS
ncbi:hypothetical protein DPX39_000053000 [Trypanosoma brucei equiperdum]|uniref:Uncharacterized protein n=1 Tax=Trypanosoma brucei equiperdum TaxID=630700 RepID=A0A3L6KS45_9TRYP|nr:hypothetical protein DPX39_000053000 [Trypanosoma brucei equiperdum]